MFPKAFNFGRKRSGDGNPRRSPSPHSSRPRIFLPDQNQESASRESLHPRAASAAGLSIRNRNEGDQGPLGLNVIYKPENGQKVDIVFIHGLGGSSRMTWSKYKNPELFWPLTFLPLEPDLCLARILSFGYHANFRKAGSASTVVLDFAKELLYDLKYGTDEQQDSLKMGNVPLLFVVHSMGGLIVKEAYMQGQNDPQYEKIVKSISAITFLATPHRGTNLADLLNRILQSTGVSNSKQYISELAKNSFTLQKLNEQFRHIAPRLDIVSFYETQPTSIGFKSARVMVLEKDSSVLGYPGEISKALNADHHGMCKYEDPKDPNYITVRNILKSLVSKIISTSRPDLAPASNRRGSRDLKAMLAISELPDTDYIFFRDQWTPGTNHWILQDDTYVQWLTSPGSTSRLLWLNGGAATGKSVLSSFIINSLVEQRLCCQYFFIRFGDRKKRTLSLLLRSIAYQIALQVPSFMQKVTEVADEAIDFETADPRIIWERIFKSLLFRMEEQEPLYWVIDGLDEADDTRAAIKLLSDIIVSFIPIRILILSRDNPDISTALKKMPKTLHQSTISLEGHLEDLRCHIRRELSMFSSPDFMEGILHRIVDGSQSNFLWVRLAVEKINSCHTQADVERALQELPSGMEAIYDRMALSISQNPSHSDQALASSILQLITCSFRALKVVEVLQALDEDLSGMLDFQQSIKKLCGGFVVVDNSGNVSMIHQTAREYLLSHEGHLFQVDREAAHEKLFLSCMRCLMSPGLRSKINKSTMPEFLNYSAYWWSSHLALIKLDREQVLNVLNKFLTGHWILTWIQVLASDKQLRILVQASKHLSKYAARRKDYFEMENERFYLVAQRCIESWSVDLVKVVGKFGTSLGRNPETIYKMIPPFCPHNSAIYQQFGKSEAKSLMVSGFSTPDWDDSLARLSLGFNTYASSIAAAGSQIAILAGSGSVFIHDSSAFDQTAASPIQHGERVYRMELSRNGTLLVTYGFKTTKIWDIATGKCKLTVENLESRPRPLAMLLTNNNKTLLVGTEDRRIRSLNLEGPSPKWQLVAELEEQELEGHFLNSSSYMALNNDGSLVVVAYRGHPLSAWEVDGPVQIGHCWRARDEVARGEVIEAVWHPHTSEVLGLYIEGVVFKWNPYEGEPEEISTGASRLAISRDGNLFATGDVRGTVKVYTTSEFSLLYQLASQDSVLGLAFSPDLRRFYDIRGYYGNAWEPNSLMRYAEQTRMGAGSDSETESIVQSTVISTNSSLRIDLITVLAASPTGRLYCCGTESGTVTLYDTQKGKLSDCHVSKAFLSIEHLCWSDDGRRLCFSDSSKKVYIASIDPATGSGIIEGTKVEVSMIRNTKGPIIQLLFQPNSSQLLVATSFTTCTFSIDSASIENSLDLQLDGLKWARHPLDPTLILAFGPDTIKILDWSLIEKGTICFEYLLHDNSQPELEGPRTRDSGAVDRVLVTQDKKHMLVQMSAAHRAKEKTFLYFPTTSFSLPASSSSAPEQIGSTKTITPIVLPRHLTSRIALALSFLSHDRLIFLSGTFSISSWQIPSNLKSHGIADLRSTVVPSTHRNSHLDASAERSIRELFVLPGDWMSRDCLSLCSLWSKERSFLCPRNGEVAVVRSAGLV